MASTLQPAGTADRGRRALRLLGLLLLLLCAFPPSARTAPYSVYACSGPGGVPLANSSWASSLPGTSQGSNFVFGTVCPLTVTADTGNALPSGAGGEYGFDPPAGTSISGYRIERSAQVGFSGSGGGQSVSAGIREGAGSSYDDRDCIAVSVSCSFSSEAVERSGLALSRLALGAYCIGPGSCPPGAIDLLGVTLASARVDIEDGAPPPTPVIAGSLPGSTSPGGIRSVSATAEDSGGGVRRIEFAVDGVTVAGDSPGGSCAEPYTLVRPCPESHAASFPLDTGGLAQGLHTGSVRAFDASGNASAAKDFAFNVTAAEGPGPPSNGTPAVGRPVLRSSRSLLADARQRSLLVRGTLRSEQGEPIAGARLEVDTVDLAVFDSRVRPLGEVITAPDGSFVLRVRVRGAQRITFSFRPGPESPVTARSSTIVRERLSLSISRSKARVPAGGLLLLTGRLTGAGAAAAGAPVEIDARIGGQWRAVGVVEAGRRGEYRWRYRFVRVTEPTRFIFRALVRRSSAWPWPDEISRPVRVVAG